ncbi:MAG: 4a-hydroxytetrahydrobiopterin dehydratase [Desulfobacteraceae bacterium]|nr:4a-hydroxytetrahydrobiopterin dehydratase [Desulfobacteraceae bacterium]
MNLADKHCSPAQPGTTPLSPKEAEDMKNHIHPDWVLTAGATMLKRVFRFKNFKAAMDHGVIVGNIAEQENHHPDLLIAWGRLDVLITTHKIKGLTESDFIFAAKVDAVFSAET